jgi:hypothetical protein
MGKQGRGNRTRIILGSETTQGEAASSFRRLRWVTESLSEETNPEINDEITEDRMRREPADMNFRPGGDLNCRLHIEGAITTLYKHLMGAVSSSGSGPYTHIFTPAASLPEGFTLEKGILNLGGSVKRYHQFLGCRIPGATFNLTQEGVSRVTFNVLPLKTQVATSSFDDAPTGSTIRDLSGNMGALYEGEAGASPSSLIASIRTLTLNLSNNLDEEGFAVSGDPTTSRQRVDENEGYADATGSAAIRCVDGADDWFDDFKAGTPAAIRWRSTDPNSNYYIEFFFPRIKWAGRPTPQVDGVHGLVQSFDFRAYYDATFGYSHRITLYNNEANVP